MTYKSARFLPAVLAIFLLPVFAAGSDSNNNSPAPKNANESSADIKANNGTAPAANAANDPLLKLLVSKGVLSASEAGSLAGSSSGEMRDRLLSL
ncbi:MAG TPA: hypothetical protein VKT33_08905, partial [Candidatus Angelobacter sp.]|nr:hypothetical protein [Candidatus Angelobacter sp.]